MQDDARQLLCDLMAFRAARKEAFREIRVLRQRVVLLTGRIDLADANCHDDALRSHLIDAVEDYLD